MLDDPVGPRAGDADVVGHRQVLHHLAQPDAAGVRAHGNAVVGGEEEDREVLVDPRDAGGVDLDDVDGAGLQELLEHDAVGDVLTGRDLDGVQCAPDGGVPEHVVGAGGFLDPVRVERGQGAHPRDRVPDVPALVRVDRDADVVAHGGPRDPHAAHVVLEVRTHLELDLREPVRDGLLGQPGELVVGVAEPTGGRRVRGVPDPQEFRFAFGAAGDGAAQQVEGLPLRHGVGEPAEVDEGDDLLGVQVGQEPPEGLPGALGAQVPRGVEHRADRHLHDALLRAEPAQLRFVDHLLGERPEVAEDLVDAAADDERCQRVDRGGLQVVAAARREGQGVALESVTGVGAQHRVRRGVVRLGVHGVRAVEVLGGGEPDVVDVQARDDGGGGQGFLQASDDSLAVVERELRGSCPGRSRGEVARAAVGVRRGGARPRCGRRVGAVGGRALLQDGSVD